MKTMVTYKLRVKFDCEVTVPAIEKEYVLEEEWSSVLEALSKKLSPRWIEEHCWIEVLNAEEGVHEDLAD